MQRKNKRKHSDFVIKGQNMSDILNPHERILLAINNDDEEKIIHLLNDMARTKNKKYVLGELSQFVDYATKLDKKNALSAISRYKEAKGNIASLHDNHEVIFGRDASGSSSSIGSNNNLNNSGSSIFNSNGSFSSSSYSSAMDISINRIDLLSKLVNEVPPADVLKVVTKGVKAPVVKKTSRAEKPDLENLPLEVQKQLNDIKVNCSRAKKELTEAKKNLDSYYVEQGKQAFKTKTRVVASQGKKNAEEKYLEISKKLQNLEDSYEKVLTEAYNNLNSSGELNNSNDFFSSSSLALSVEKKIDTELKDYGIPASMHKLVRRYMWAEDILNVDIFLKNFKKFQLLIMLLSTHELVRFELAKKIELDQVKILEYGYFKHNPRVSIVPFEILLQTQQYGKLQEIIQLMVERDKVSLITKALNSKNAAGANALSKALIFDENISESKLSELKSLLTVLINVGANLSEVKNVSIEHIIGLMMVCDYDKFKAQIYHISKDQFTNLLAEKENIDEYLQITMEDIQQKSKDHASAFIKFAYFYLRSKYELCPKNSQGFLSAGNSEVLTALANSLAFVDEIAQDNSHDVVRNAYQIRQAYHNAEQALAQLKDSADNAQLKWLMATVKEAVKLLYPNSDLTNRTNNNFRK